MELATVVIDNGTGYSKMGFAGNLEPSYIIPSVIATKPINVTSTPHSLTSVEPIQSSVSEVPRQPRPGLLYRR